MWLKNLFKTNKIDRKEINPDEIFLDSTNIPKFDRYQFEGSIERSIGNKAGYGVGIFALLIFLIFAGKLWSLEVKNYRTYTTRSENNRLRFATVFSERGKILDRNGLIIAENNDNPDATQGYQTRIYRNTKGIGNAIGFVKYPKTDSAGFYYETEVVGKDGIEEAYNSVLAGENGVKIVEVNVYNQVQSEGLYSKPQNGKDLKLSFDTRLTKVFYDFMEKTAAERGFSGGAAALMDIETGELPVLISFPEYEPQILTDGKNAAALKNYSDDPRTPYLDRPINGLYAPGSIVKPFIAVGVLNEKIIAPETIIVSTGSISIPNEYDPTKKSVFKDWRVNGPVDLRKALAVSSDVYFYEVGGGFENQVGLGISRIKKYLELFGFGSPVDNVYLAGEGGVVPDPDWKEKVFPDDPWRIGDTYNITIGQYGLQVTPIQMVRAISAIANSGKMVEPTVIFQDGTEPIKKIDTGVPAEYFQIVKEGLRQAVTEGTAAGLNIPQVAVAAKTGTAEVGITKKRVNSWVIGFFPYDEPRYAFAVLMEKGPSDNTVGALYVMRQFLEWASVNAPEILRD
jgi:penicillin-binding protein 2